MAPSPVGAPTVGGPTASDVLALLLAWLPSRRWYPEKGMGAVPVPVGEIGLVDPAGAATVGVHLLRLTSGAVLQVPLVLRPAGGAHVNALGTVVRDGAELVVLDGCADPAFLRAWLAVAGRDPGTPPDLVAGDLDAPGAARVLTGEQSNTSVLLPAADPPSILKVFRLLSPGQNPDVAVPSALHGVGWTGVPRPLGWLSGTWPNADGEPVTGHLGVVSELVVGARDGFELACALAGAARDLGPLARELGRTTAQLHAALRRALPVADGPASAVDVRATLLARATSAIDAVPALAERSERILRVLDLVTTVGDLPALQHVHGDYHLGQVLHSAERGWFVLDFEGEPSASADERERPDLALRDLAGMLRSLDYAAAIGDATDPRWLSAARRALTQGYHAESASLGAGSDPVAAATLLRALELDKALYEVVYETRNRPTWASIPLAGVDRLLSADLP